MFALIRISNCGERFIRVCNVKRGLTPKLASNAFGRNIVPDLFNGGMKIFKY